MKNPLRDDDIRYVCDLVHRHSGVVLQPEQSYLVEARLTLAARRSGLVTAEELVESLRNRPEGALHNQVVEEITARDTRFFRDATPFRVLREEVLPGLIDRRRDERRLNIWSAGCSTGQEPYSIALMLEREFPELEDWEVGILATDFAGAAIDRVRDARYTQLEVNRGLSRPMLEDHFDREDVWWNLHDRIKRRVRPERMNLVDDWPEMEPVDVVLLRNVLLYFDDETRQRVLGRTRDVLREDGTLFLGATETPLCLEDTFERTGDGLAAAFRLAGTGR